MSFRWLYRTVTANNQPADKVKIEVVQGGPAPGKTDVAQIPLERTSVTGILHKDGTVSMARGAPHVAPAPGSGTRTPVLAKSRAAQSVRRRRGRLIRGPERGGVPSGRNSTPIRPFRGASRGRPRPRTPRPHLRGTTPRRLRGPKKSLESPTHKAALKRQRRSGSASPKRRGASD